MAAISENFGFGGANLTPGGAGTPTVAGALRDVADDLAEVRTQFVALLTKLDADSGDTGGDADFVATLSPAALLTTKV